MFFFCDPCVNHDCPKKVLIATCNCYYVLHLMYTDAVLEQHKVPG